MPPNELPQYRLSPAARRDLEEIWLYSAEKWSVDQAERYTDALEEAFDRLSLSPKPLAKHLFTYK